MNLSRLLLELSLCIGGVVLVFGQTTGSETAAGQDEPLLVRNFGGYGMFIDSNEQKELDQESVRNFVYTTHPPPP